LCHWNRIKNGELRWKTLGMVGATLFLLIAHTIEEHDEGETIRIISAREEDRKEKRRYEQEHR